MITELTWGDFAETAAIYFKTARSQNPPGEITPGDAEAQLKKNFVHKRYFVFISKNTTVDGILIFRKIDKRVKIFFIGACPAGKGTGATMLRHLGKWCIEKHVGIVQATVSGADERAKKFYIDRCGFKVFKEKRKPGFSEIEIKIDAKDLAKI